MNEGDIAVVIVTYKCAALTIACLDSIRAERESLNRPVRVVVVDNASGDLTQIQEAVARNAWSSWVTLVAAPKNGGFAYGNNIGIERAYAQGPPAFIHLLNPDTEVRPGGIASLADFLDSHPGVGIVGSSFETASGEEWPFAFRFPSMLSELDRGLHIGLVTRCLSRWIVAKNMAPVAQRTDWISGASMMIRPQVLASIGTLDENFFLYFEETEFCHRASRAGFSTWYVPSSRVMHMIGQSTQLDDASRVRKRLPSYWFESRRRYFAATRGIGYAAWIDIVALASGVLGLVKQSILRRSATPRFLRDLLRHSALLPKNRHLAPLQCYFPPR